MTSELKLIKKDALKADENPTAGMTRAHAITANGLTSGTVTTAPGIVSGWHHHGTHETSIYVVKGALRMEFATGAFEAHEGDFIHVPAGAVHRESNPGTEPNLAVFSRAGTGTVTVNVDAPPKR
ncbi:MAG TPA: cupin domain-containing protein [Candidatus Limnocylindria bacterium]